MSDNPTTPAGLPRNREADAWRLRAEQAESRLDVTERVALLFVAFTVSLVVVYSLALGERDAARAQVAAAEQRAERAEAGLCLRAGDAAPMPTWPPPRFGDDVGVTMTPGTLPVGPCATGVTGALCLYDRGQP